MHFSASLGGHSRTAHWHCPPKGGSADSPFRYLVRGPYWSRALGKCPNDLSVPVLTLCKATISSVCAGSMYKHRNIGFTHRLGGLYIFFTLIVMNEPFSFRTVIGHTGIKDGKRNKQEGKNREGGIQGDSPIQQAKVGKEANLACFPANCRYTTSLEACNSWTTCLHFLCM